MINEIDFVDMIAVPYLNVLAMENWGLVTYQRPFLVIPINAGFKTKYESTLVIAHEIAHQVERYNHYCNDTIIWFIMWSHIWKLGSLRQQPLICFGFF